MTVRSTYFPMLLSFVAAFAPPPAAWALPLAPEACERARGEQTELSSKGVAIDVAKGGEWGRANLDRARLAQVARWIELEEQILFRCPRPPIEAKAQPGSDDTKTKATEGAVKPKPKAPEKSTRKEAEENKPAPAAKPKPKPKPKPRDDAYIPPAPQSGHEIQHATPGAPEPALPWSLAP